jgi:hypothetical protein
MRIHAIRKMPLSIDEAGSRCTSHRPIVEREKLDARDAEKSFDKFSLFIRN